VSFDHGDSFAGLSRALSGPSIKDVHKDREEGRGHPNADVRVLILCSYSSTTCVLNTNFSHLDDSLHAELDLAEIRITLLDAAV